MGDIRSLPAGAFSPIPGFGEVVSVKGDLRTLHYGGLFSPLMGFGKVDTGEGPVTTRTAKVGGVMLGTANPIVLG